MAANFIGTLDPNLKQKAQQIYIRVLVTGSSCITEKKNQIEPDLISEKKPEPNPTLK